MDESRTQVAVCTYLPQKHVPASDHGDEKAAPNLRGSHRPKALSSGAAT